MPVLARLEAETHAYHRDTELPWLALLSPHTTRADYADLLVRAYGFEQPFEAALAYTTHATSLVAPRRRARLLAADLAALDRGWLSTMARSWIAPFPGVAEAFGWLYAVERTARLYSMVCGNILARIPDLAPATTFLDDRTAFTRWRELGTALDRIARTPRVEDVIVTSAHSAFHTLIEWYSARRPAVRLGA